MKTKTQEFLDAASELSLALMRRSFGREVDVEEFEQIKERALRAKIAMEQEAVQDFIDDMTDNDRRKWDRQNRRQETTVRGPKIGTNLGDLLRKAKP